MKREPLVSRCCSVPGMMEPICLLTEKSRTTFAKVAVCSACSKVIGEPKPVWGCAIRPMEKKSWGTSYSLLLDARRERPGTPLYFVDKDGVLVPEATAHLTPVQKELPDDGVPF